MSKPTPTSRSGDTGPVTNPQPTARTRWWPLFLAALATVLGVLLGATTASAATVSVAETRVGATGVPAPAVVGFDAGVWASQHHANAPPQAETASATGVATNTARSVGTTVGDLRAAGQSDAHHIIQDAAVRDLPGYATNAAPGVQLAGPSTLEGSAHYEATVVQRAAGGGTYGAERQIAYNALKAAGYSDAEAAAEIARADAYFIDQLGVTMETPTRVPGNRAGG